MIFNYKCYLPFNHFPTKEEKEEKEISLIKALLYLKFKYITDKENKNE